MPSSDEDAALATEQQFWEELDAVVTADCATHELIDDALRNYLAMTREYKEHYLQTEYDVARCSYKLLDSTLFAAHAEYVRRQLIYCLLQEDDPPELHMVAAVLLFDGKQNEMTFEDMNAEETFPRLLELIETVEDADVALHRILLQLMYEMSRIQRIKVSELMLIEDDFILRLLQITETLSDDVGDPYHYPVIRVLLVLNEQYMVCAHDPAPTQAAGEALPNRVIGMLATHGHAFKTFGENIILLLNRESETSLQLLILKLLYLLFTTPATYEYFYTNDLRVLVDVVIRNLLDLPHAASALRHTYLRVLHPLLAHTQLAEPENNYKREELLKVLRLLTGVGMDGPAAAAVAHFGATDETTKRLGARCVAVSWLRGDADLALDMPVAILTTDAAAARETATATHDLEFTTLIEAPSDKDHSPPPTTNAKHKLTVPKRPPPRKGSSAAVAAARRRPETSQSPTPRTTTQSPSPSSSPTPAHRRARSTNRPSPPPPRRGASSARHLSPPAKPASATRAQSSSYRPAARIRSPARKASARIPSPPPPRKGSSAGRYLALGALGAQDASASSLSVAAVASPRAKPGVITPSLGRHDGVVPKEGDEEGEGEGEGEEESGKEGEVANGGVSLDGEG